MATVHQRVDGFNRVVFVRFFFVVFNQVGALSQDGGAAEADRRALVLVGEQQLLDGIEQTPDPWRRGVRVNAVFDVVNGVNEIIDQLRRLGFVGKLRQRFKLIDRAQESGAVGGGARLARFFCVDGVVQPRMLRQRGELLTEALRRIGAARHAR